ncbi:FMRFamide neuropeptide [Chionoecetes opilio]|uniref:FMRFamide neuropeptide n=1 Tax=Chionoecetes opilio TaxID=41210 RepID=A0A8J4XYE8_CHIOP|nr:FMRFamide neuropeptide [Chionoecetes opilio]
MEDLLEPITDAENSIEKRNRNFLRFGRNRNFLRFGRSDPEDFSLPGGPLAFANGVQDNDLNDYSVEEKRAAGHRNYLRFGRGNRNFLRFGRNDNRNFLRFGRSVDNQLSEQKDRDVHMTPTAGPHSPAKTQEAPRTKRQAGPYSYVVMPSHGPAAWGQDYQPDQVDEDLEVAVDGPEVTKRAYNRSFLRFGRNRNFLRFGKRKSDDDPNLCCPPPLPPNLRGPPAQIPNFWFGGKGAWAATLPSPSPSHSFPGTPDTNTHAYTYHIYTYTRIHSLIHRCLDERQSAVAAPLPSLPQRCAGPLCCAISSALTTTVPARPHQCSRIRRT